MIEPVIIADADRKRVDAAWLELRNSGLVNPVRHIRTCEALLGYVALYADQSMRTPAAILIDFALFQENAGQLVEYLHNASPHAALTILADTAAEQQQVLRHGWATVDCLLRPLHACDVLGCATRRGHPWAIVSDPRTAGSGESDWRVRALHLTDVASNSTRDDDKPIQRTSA